MIYKINIKSLTIKLLVISFVFTIICGFLLENFNLVIYLISFFIIVGIEIIIFFFGVYLIEIKINKNDHCVSLHFRKYLINDYFIEIPYNELYFSFKRETGARGVKFEELRLYNNKKEKIIGIGKGFDGWERKAIHQIIKNFKELNILEIE